jgi:FKBP-type peptidyl-prolyl cis-trans isomerase FkpA
MTRFFITLATLSLFIVSCNKMQKTPSGLEYKIFKSTGGDKIAAGDFVFFKVKGMVGDSALYNTYKNVHSPYMSMPVQENFSKGNFEEGLTLLAAGDSALFKINADSFFNKYVGAPAPAFIKKGESINFYVKVDSFLTKKTIGERKAKHEAEVANRRDNEPTIIEDYVKSTGLKFTTTKSGMYYIITNETKGAKASIGDTISANYTGKLLNGKVFDTNSTRGQLFEFALGKKAVIPGWDEIFSILRVGEKATIVIPSSLAYGAQGAGADIEAYTPLVFDVELVKTNKSKK